MTKKSLTIIANWGHDSNLNLAESNLVDLHKTHCDPTKKTRWRESDAGDKYFLLETYPPYDERRKCAVNNADDLSTAFFTF